MFFPPMDQMTKKFVQIYLAQGLQDLFMKYVIMIQLWGPHGQILSINTHKVSHCIVFFAISIYCKEPNDLKVGSGTPWDIVNKIY